MSAQGQKNAVDGTIGMVSIFIEHIDMKPGSKKLPSRIWRQRAGHPYKKQGLQLPRGPGTIGYVQPLLEAACPSNSL